MQVQTELDWWWIVLIMLGAVLMVCGKLVLRLIRGSTEIPLPALDRTPRAARVLGVESAPRRRPRGAHAARLPGDLWLVRVEYRDASGALRREFLADVIHDDDIHRFTAGSTWQVYGFEKPQATAQGGRALLTDAHDDVPRCGYNLDGVRVRGRERKVWNARLGSPFFGVMAFRDDATWYSEPVTGRRRSWPGDPAEVWLAAGGTSSSISRPHSVPVVDSAEQVARWEDPSRMTNTVTYAAPIFWVVLPVLALGALVFLGWGDGFTWEDDVIGVSEDDGPWGMWTVWIAVLVWLLIAGGVLVFRVRFYPLWDRESAEWILEQGAACEVHASPFEFDGGEGSSTPGRILIDHRIPDVRAARIVRAFRTWLWHEDVQQELHYGTLHDYGCIASEEIFGPGAAGGYFTATDAEVGGWILLTPIRDEAQEGDEPLWRRATITNVPADAAVVARAASR